MIRASSRTVIRALVAALGMGMAGLLVALYMNDGEALSEGRFYLSTLIGAALGGASLSALFGLPERKGWAWAAVGGFCATMLGAALAGSIYGMLEGMGPITGGVFGPVVVGMWLLSDLPALLIWAALVAATHLALRRLAP